MEQLLDTIIPRKSYIWMDEETGIFGIVLVESIYKIFYLLVTDCFLEDSLQRTGGFPVNLWVEGIPTCWSDRLKTPTFRSHSLMATFQQTPGAYPKPPTKSLWFGIPFIWGFGDSWGMLQGYVGVLLESNLYDVSFYIWSR